MKSITSTILCCLFGIQFAFAQERPNIVYIICDDLGYGDVSSLNPDKGKIPTPEIDALASQGITFTDAHSGSSVCTPSRYGVLTGRYAWRSRLQEGVLRGGDEFDPLIADDQLTVPQMLKKVGYTTAAMGKWHLGFRYLDENGETFNLYEGKKLLDIPIGSTVPDGPTTRGFDSYIGFHHSAAMKTVIKDNKVVDHMPPINMLQFLGDHATTYVQEKAEDEQPFFLYLALNSPHSPVVPSEPWQGKSGMGLYADFVMETDYVVGRVIKALKENGIAENTLVFFSSDNGCSFPVAKGHQLEKKFGHYPSANFRGAKSDIWEGGHRIPFIVSWPGKIKANSQSDELICLTNLMATCAALTGAPMTEVDGEDSFSILPILRNSKAKSDQEAVVHHSINGKFSIRKGKWKLELTPGSGGWSAATDAKALEAGLPEAQLYNMKRDEEETTNVYHKYPKVVEKLTAELTEIVENGRSTPGKKLQNDVRVDIYKNAETTKNPVDYIDPSIGTVTYGKKSKDAHGFGKTFPGAATPFGLVQLSPDTYSGGDNGSGYSYEHPTLEGFSFTHMSGVGWFGDLGNFLLTPTTGPLYKNRGVPENPEEGYRSRYSHDTEVTEAGYYAVTLEDYKIRAELTAAQRAGIIRFTFPENKNSRIQIDLARRVGGTSTEQYIEVVDEQTIAGWMKCPPEGGGWGAGAGNADYVVYFYCQFSKPLKDYGVWRADLPDVPRKMRFIRRDEYQNAIKEAPVALKAKKMQGNHLGFYTEFETAENEVVLVKSGISFVDIAGAKANLAHDINHWNFDQVKEQARNLWNQAVKKIAVEGGTEDEKTIFYSALYHTMIDPRTFSDVNGNYIGADKKVYQSKDFTYRTIFSGWDVFRSQFPLQTIINPELVNDEVNSLLQMAELSGKGYLPRWELLNAYSGCMLGNPAVSVIVDAYQKGIRNYDVDKAFTYSKNTVDNTGNGILGYSHKNISKTLEYAYTDWALGTFAESLGKKEIAKTYLEKGKNYQNIWNDEVDWFRAKDSLGTWLEWKGKTVHGQGCIESNPFQQGWFVPHDIDGLKKMMGGEEAFKEELISFFEQTPEDFLWNNYYNHPNEPVHHVPFMFNTAGVPHLTQEWTRKICSEAYGTGPYGLCGNEDVGQMSAWYILAAMGIHPICPGDNKYEITSPVFSEIVLNLDQKYYAGKQFKILAKNNSTANIYIQKIELNGKALERFYLTHQEITNGGTLVLTMGPEPNI